MYITAVPTKTSTGKMSHICYLLRESYRENGKVKTRTIKNLTHCKPEMIQALRLALQRPQDVYDIQNKDLSIKQGQSIGAVWLLHVVAEKLGITKALGENIDGKLALWQVIARVLEQGSRLSAARLASKQLACDILDIDTGFTEDHLYKNLAWLTKNQEEIELKLLKNRRKEKNLDLFLYDVTSSYLEGEQNELGAYGYNRDGKKGKLQVVVGLLCDNEGMPVSVQVYEGNTSDLKTFYDQIVKVKEKYSCKRVTFVGDRGMIKSSQIEDLKEEDFYYITSITKAQIETLLKNNVIQMELFDKNISEVESEGVRYIVRKNSVRLKEVRQTRERKMVSLQEFIDKINEKLKKPRVKQESAIKKVENKISKYKISYVSVESNERTLSLVINQDKLNEVEKLDGCYVIKSDLPSEISSDTIHARYKDLGLVETAFRTSKTSFLEMRPWYVRKEESTRGHALVVMLAYHIVHHLKEVWSSFNLTVEEGLTQLNSISSLEITFPDGITVNQIMEPNDENAKLLEAASVVLPKVLPHYDVNVGSRKELQTMRKTA
jgi:transposase